MGIKVGQEQVLLPKSVHRRSVPKPLIEVDAFGAHVASMMRKQWAAWWRTPMSSQWDRVGDLPGLSMAIQLFGVSVAKGLSAQDTATYVRLLGQFGLTPSGRKQLGWIMPDADSAEAGDAAPRGAARSGPRRLEAM